MDHSDEDRKPPAAPQQQGLTLAQQQQQAQRQQQILAQQQLPQYAQGSAAIPAELAAGRFQQGSALPYAQQNQSVSLRQPAQQPMLYGQQYAGYPAAQAEGFPQVSYLTQQQQVAQQQAVVAAQQPVVAVIPQPQRVPAAYPNVQPPPQVGRPAAKRPLVKLSVSLIDTYKHINTVYYEERDARRAARAKEKGAQGSGAQNNGWDDENYDYIITPGEVINKRYKIRERIGKGSFGQVVRAEDMQNKTEVAIKIIKSKRPFQMQAKTEIELLTRLRENDPQDEHNIGTWNLQCLFPFLSPQLITVRLLTHFMYRNHQCLVFEMLSLNLYELLKNTKFGGVSLNLIRKFARQVLKALMFLSRSDVDIIHCDLKPENILLRHPKKSGIKVIDFGSSCRSDKRMYSYIQSRFYRSPEVMLGLPYSVAIDMWSLGCILAEMHTGEPLFSGSDQFDQMQKIVKLLGMVPNTMLNRSNEDTRSKFFNREASGSGHVYTLRQVRRPRSEAEPEEDPPAEPMFPSQDPIASLTQVIHVGNRQRSQYPPSEAHNSPTNYALFIDLVHSMLSFEPTERITPEQALQHPFICDPAPVAAVQS